MSRHKRGGRFSWERRGYRPHQPSANVELGAGLLVAVVGLFFDWTFWPSAFVLSIAALVVVLRAIAVIAGFLDRRRDL